MVPLSPSRLFVFLACLRLALGLAPLAVTIDQNLFVIGSAMCSAYYGYYETWGLCISNAVAGLLVIYLLGLKIYLDEVVPRRSAQVGATPATDALVATNLYMSDDY